jgi:hypothetical protein
VRVSRPIGFTWTALDLEVAHEPAGAAKFIMTNLRGPETTAEIGRWFSVACYCILPHLLLTIERIGRIYPCARPFRSQSLGKETDNVELTATKTTANRIAESSGLGPVEISVDERPHCRVACCRFASSVRGIALLPSCRWQCLLH